jgi:hypothetical protein
VYGRAGGDLFVFGPNDFSPGPAFDAIMDFNSAQGDEIDLSAIDAVVGGGDDAFAFIGAAAFNGVAGELRYSAITGGVAVEADTDGDAAADFRIDVLGVTSIGPTDFLL